MNHQTVAAQAMVETDAFLLADEPGLGKTAPLAWAALEKSRRQGGSKILVMCPRNVIDHWYRTFETLQPGSSRKLFVTNYEQGKNIGHSALEGVGVFIPDEAHKLKNENSGRFQTVYQMWSLMQQACMWRGFPLATYASSGTPVYSYPIDLMTILVLLGKLPPASVPMFKARYCDPKRRNLPGKPGRLDFRGSTHMDELRRDCAPFILRRSWKDAGIEMPALTMTDIIVNDKINHPEYVKASADFKAYYVANGGRPQGAGMARFTVLRRLLAEAKAPEVVEQALDDLKGGQHTFIVTEFRDVATMIYERLAGAGLPAGLIIGGQSAAARQGIIDAFTNSKDPAVIVATTDSIGEGTDGLQRVCHLVNVVDSDFDPSMFVQVIKRLWRWGQRHPCHVRRFVVEGDAMEAFITKNIRNKNTTMRALGLEDSVSMTQLSKGG